MRNQYSPEVIEISPEINKIKRKTLSPDEILKFCEEYRKFDNRVPLVAVPTTYNKITEKELINAGVSIVIYANHLLRSAYPAMKKQQNLF